MRTLRRFVKRLGSWARTRQDEERLRLEIQEHLDLQTAENLRAGLSPAEARRQALLKFVSKLFRNVPFLTSLEMSPFVLVPLLFLVLLWSCLSSCSWRLFLSLSLACPERSPASPWASV